MIKQLRLTNFQSHADSICEFSDGVNCIVGASDSGKSAILRALYWVIHNRPSGTSVIRNGETEAQVVVTTDDAEVLRIRTKSKNDYTVTRDGQSTVYSTVGRDVPEDVTTTLGLREINLQSQFDPTYLLFDSPGQVAGVFNSFTNLDKVDKAVQRISSELRSLSTTLERAEAEKSESETIYEDMAWVDELQTLVTAYDAKASTLATLRTAYAQLRVTLEQYKAILTTYPTNIPQLRTAHARYLELHDALTRKADQLFMRLSSLRQLQTRQLQLSRILADLPDIPSLQTEVEHLRPFSDSAASQVAQLLKISAAYMEAVNKQKILSKEVVSVRFLLSSYFAAVEDTTVCRTAVASLKQKVADTATSAALEVERIIRDAGHCMTCGQLLTDDAVNFIANSK